MARIALIGLPGSGKSTVGPLLGAALECSAFDTDGLLESHSGWSPSRWISELGWSTFRSAESVVLSSIHRQYSQIPMILSCGGGIAELEENRTLLESWKCIWLDASDDVLIARTRGTDRPVLEGLSPEDLMIQLREQRVEKYRSLAGTPIDTSLRSPEDVVLEIIDRMESE